MNDLTKQLLAEGYTPDNPPPYAKWHSGWRHFEYTLEAVSKMVWETPCGLLRKGSIQDGCGWGSVGGVDYRPENNNLRIGCPYYYNDRHGECNERDCDHRDPASPSGWNCTTQRTDRHYDYDQSVEKILDEWDKVQHEAFLEASKGYGYCACMEWARAKRKYVPRYDVMKCIDIGCKNEVCVITKRTRNLKKVNIYYDILRERHYKKGLFEFADRMVEKGVRQFGSAVALTDAEMWLKMYGKRFRPRLTKDDRRELHFSKHHGKTGYGEYDWAEYTVTPQNIRIERRESRDLLQDLRDIQAGIEVVHASDLQKRQKEAYRERKSNREATKSRKIERRVIKNLKLAAYKGVNDEGAPVGDVIKAWAKKQLDRRGVTEQISLFQDGI